ncbi:MAG: nitroreductase family protein [Dehalococcoidia bacterium]|nr:nitroreductase family protein [Dehalococcoidia bacterium]
MVATAGGEPVSIEQAIRARRSVRGLLGPPLDDGELRALVALALAAPAPHHTRPWRFVDVAPPRREPLATALGEVWRADMEADGVPRAQQVRALARSRRQLVSAPTLLLGCLVPDGLRRYPDEQRWRAEWGLAQQSFGAAVQNLLLAADGRGLGAFWISAPLYAQQAVRAALDLDAEWEPQALVALGRRDPGYTPFDRPEPDLGRHLVRR